METTTDLRWPVNPKNGEHYIGIKHDRDGKPESHLVIVAINNSELDWHKNHVWATTMGAELSTIFDLRFIRAHRSDLLKRGMWWAADVHCKNSDFSFALDTFTGTERLRRKSEVGFGVAVRRVLISAVDR